MGKRHDFTDSSTNHRLSMVRLLVLLIADLSSNHSDSDVEVMKLTICRKEGELLITSSSAVHNRNKSSYMKLNLTNRNSSSL